MPVPAAALAPFNLDPLSQMDGSWLAAHGGARSELMETLSDSPDARPKLARYLLDHHKLTGTWWTDFSSPRSRIALLDRDVLQTVLLRTGLLVKGNEIRRDLDGARRRSTRAGIGDEDMDFVLRTAPLLGRPKPIDYECDHTDPRHRFMAFGLAASLDRGLLKESAYRVRLALRLPKQLAETLSDLADTDRSPGGSRRLSALTRRVVKDLAPPWLTLFD